MGGAIFLHYPAIAFADVAVLSSENASNEKSTVDTLFCGVYIRKKG